MNGMDSIFGIIGVVLGIYAFNSWYQLKLTKDLTKSVLLPKEVNVKKCKDKEAYIKETLPKLLILGITALLYGAIELVNSMVKSIPTLITISLIGSGIVIVYIGIVTAKMNKKYFPGL